MVERGVGGDDDHQRAVGPRRDRLGPLEQKGAERRLRDTLRQAAQPQRTAEVALTLPVTAAAGRETLKLSLAYYYCRAGAEGLCKVGSVRWTVPLIIDNSASNQPVVLSHEVR